MTRQRLEQFQLALYLPAVGAGIVLGLWLQPKLPDALIYAVLGLLLYSTFVQVPVLHLRDAARDLRFLTALLVANFLLVPVAVWILAGVVPPEPALRLGVYMVLLVPCTDWFIVFTHLGGGDAKRALTSTPVILLLQLLLLPLYLWVLMGPAFSEGVRAGPFLQAFLWVILMPLALATLTERWADRSLAGQRAVGILSWMPVPCLAAVMFLIAMSQAAQVVGNLRGMGIIILVFGAYLVTALGLGLAVARGFRLSPATARTLIFSLGTRNSFVVFPLVLALPPGWEAAITVVVIQPLVELVGMLVYLRWVPLLTMRCLGGNIQPAR